MGTDRSVRGLRYSCFSMREPSRSFELGVPKILAFLIPEILSDLVLAGRNSSLLPSLLGKREGRRRRMLGMLKRHEIEILLKAGHPKTEVARLAGVSARSVHRIAEENPVVDVNDSAERAL